MINYDGNNTKVHETEEGIELSWRYCWADLTKKELLRMLEGRKISWVYIFRKSIYMVIRLDESLRLVKITSNGEEQEIKTMSMSEGSASSVSFALSMLPQEDNA